MAIDRFNQRQVACKIVPLRNHNRSRSQEEELSRKLWREVDILKHISHVSKPVSYVTIVESP